MYMRKTRFARKCPSLGRNSPRLGHILGCSIFRCLLLLTQKAHVVPLKKRKNMAKKIETEQRRELARMYYMQGLTQKDIADRTGVSRNTVCQWVKEGKWGEMKAAKTITRKELVAKMLNKINEKLDSDEWTSDEMAKATSAIEKLDKQTNVVTIIEVFSAFDNWLVARMKLDPELTPELVKTMNKYQDIFIGEQLGKTTVEFK